jgi:uncharacterized membrane protein
MFRRHAKDDSKESGWLYPLLGSLALFVFVAIAAYVLTSMWRERTTTLSAEPEEMAEPADPTILELTPIEILDRRVAAGEITIEQYDELVGVLNRRFASTAWNGPAQSAVA